MPERHHLISEHLLDKARALRRNGTVPERILWCLLRGNGLGGLKFRRQYPLDPYVADFYCHEARLVVELDGMSHIGRAVEDQRRSEILRARGLRILRIDNEDVLRNLEGVGMAILRAAGIEPY